MRIALLCLLVAACSAGQPGASLVTSEEVVCKQAVAAGSAAIGTWTITMSGCTGSMKLEQDDPVASGVWGCAKDGYSVPLFAGTVRIGPSAAGIGLFFTDRTFMEGQIMRGTLSADGKKITGAFDTRGNGPAPGLAFEAVRQQ